MKLVVIHEEFGEAAVGVVIKGKSKIMYSSQAGGYECHYPSAAGHYVPIEEELKCIPKLKFFFEKNQFNTHNPITACSARGIDAILKHNDQELGMSLDMDKRMLKHSYEAWLHITYKGQKAILIWPNSY